MTVGEVGTMEDWNTLPHSARLGRLTARPGQPTKPPLPAGEQALGLTIGRDGVLYLPPSVRPEQPAPLVVCLHGATGRGARSILALRPHAEREDMILLAPDSRRTTWDVIRDGGFGPDVAFIDQALARVFDRYTIDPERIAIEGFSDGASYALTLGIANGDLFSHILAFSPGFAVPPSQTGTPALFISHGVHDEVLPIHLCSRVLAPALEHAGYPLTYREFDGPHTVPPAIAEEAVEWFLGRT